MQERRTPVTPIGATDMAPPLGTPVTGISAPRGSELACLGWPQEAAYRMLQNNLDPEVAENPD
ncbi:MAG: hypothetical protein WKF60_12365, partial [Ilumatobacter sp.]